MYFEVKEQHSTTSRIIWRFALVSNYRVKLHAHLTQFRRRPRGPWMNKEIWEFNNRRNLDPKPTEIPEWVQDRARAEISERLKFEL